MIKWLLDISVDLDGPFTDKFLPSVEKAYCDGRYHDLPEPFGLLVSPMMDYKMQFALIRQENGKYSFLKHIVWTHK